MRLGPSVRMCRKCSEQTKHAAATGPFPGWLSQLMKRTAQISTLESAASLRHWSSQSLLSVTDMHSPKADDKPKVASNYLANR